MELCNALDFIARRICIGFVDPTGLSAFVACRLIALDKCPGVRPIGISETIRRVIGKTISTTRREEIQEAAGPLQVCAGHLSGCEAAVHAMQHIYESPETEAIIIVDASNAFNSLNKQRALQKIFSIYAPHFLRCLSTRFEKTYACSLMERQSSHKK